jgi:serine/threonine-protein kinase
MAEQMPQVIGEYKIMRPVARGPMGMVYVGNTEGNVYHAIKVLDPRIAEKSPQAKRFVNDIKGPHIFDYKAIDIGPDNRQYFVTEYLEVKPIAKDRLPGVRSAGIVDLFATLAGQMQLIHNAGVTHGNIKKSNILVRRAEGPIEARFCDFGIDYVYSPEVFSGKLFSSTFPYQAPERIKQIVTRTGTDDIAATVAMDIYALGVTLCEVLTGELPFADMQDAKALMDKKKSRKYVVVGMTRPGSSINLDKLNEVVGRATAYNPRERYQSMDEFAEGLRGCIARR